MSEQEYINKIKSAKKCEVHNIKYINKCPLCNIYEIPDKNINKLLKDIKK